MDVAVWLAAVLVSAPLLLAAPPECQIRLTDVSKQVNLDFVHTDGGTGDRYIIESVVAGLALFDYDNDGLTDIYFLNGAPRVQPAGEQPPRNALYRNNGDWTFTNVTTLVGVGDSGYGLGVVAGDFDNDGDQDLYLNNFGPNVLYQNNGDGTFTDITLPAGVDNGRKVGAGAAFLDIEGDGDLDLYAANYVDFDYDKHIVRMIGPHQFHPGPYDYPPVADTLYRNNGDGTFTDISAQSGIAAVRGTGMGMVCLDYDQDGDTDVFVCNDHLPNFLFQNDGKGHFEEVGLLAGVSCDAFGRQNGSMGADCGDYDNDGRLDLFMTDYSSELPVLYHNLGDGMFEDNSLAAGIANSTFPHVTWGTGLVDFDNDGDRDLFVACGHFMDNIRFIDDRTTVRVRNVLLENTGGAFRDVSDQCGSGLQSVEASKGAAFDDLDNDGDIDVVILNANSRPTLLRNDSQGNWLDVELIGTHATRNGAGALVGVTAEGRRQVAEVHLGRSYQSHFGTRLHFGLGTARQVDRVDVQWVGGGRGRVGEIPANRCLQVREPASDGAPDQQKTGS